MPARAIAPSVLRAATMGLVYFVAAASMIAVSRFDNGVATMWIATALLMAELARSERDCWPATLIACSIGNMMAAGLFGFGWVAAAPFAAVNMAEAVIGALLLRRMGRAHGYLDSLGGVALFAMTAGLIAAIAAVPAGLLAGIFTGMTFSKEWLAWLSGHALGTITFAPVATLVLNGEFRRSIERATLLARAEAVGLIGVMAATCLMVFSQHALPLLFMPMLPLMVITFRLGRVGTACAIVVLAIVGGTLTLLGNGPINLIQGSSADLAQMLQLYLAATVMTVLPVAAELEQRKDVFRRLMGSEARYKLITESSTDIIITLDRAGIVTYASPSLHEITGFDPDQLIGQSPRELVYPPEIRAVDAAFRRALINPEVTSIVEYRGRVTSGELKWFESHTRGIIDAQGNALGWVSAVRDISHRKSLELRLAHAATTDSLTGLANRRAFDALLDRKIDERRASAGNSCVAIFDIDFFKRVNDAHGHAVGDLVLETFAAAALRTLRAGDHIARLGGEEFGLILNNADLKQAAQICDRLRMAVARDITHAPGNVAVSITASAGIARIDGSKTRLQVMRAADDALYRAKACGRDQLAIAA